MMNELVYSKEQITPDLLRSLHQRDVLIKVKGFGMYQTTALAANESPATIMGAMIGRVSPSGLFVEVSIKMEEYWLHVPCIEGLEVLG